MIASYPHRRFQLWEYAVSHGSLLIRSPKGPKADSNIDLIFVGVDYLAAPHRLDGVVVERGDRDDFEVAHQMLGKVAVQNVFVLVSEARRHVVVAAACRIDENDGDIFDSPF